MKPFYLKGSLIQSSLLLVALFVSIPFSGQAQSSFQPYSYHLYQKLNRVQYSQETRQHTSIKPLIIDSALQPLYDSVMSNGIKERSTWMGRKIWNEHLIDVEGDDFTFFADFLPDFQVGKDFAGAVKTTWLNTRGFQAGGSIKNKFFFYTSGYENQGVFADYINDFINEHRVVPGQMFGKLGAEEQDWTYVSAIVSYSPVSNLNFTLAYDKNFIGDGYRSMLLSDISSNNTSFKFNGTFGDINVSSIWSYMLDPRERISEGFGRSGSQRKWGAFQYVDWNLNNRFSIGLFHSLLWGNRKSEQFASILEPIAEYGLGSKEAMQIGLNTKYKLLKNASVYGQLLFNKDIAGQIGFRGFDAFGIKELNFLAEYNFAQPHSYSTEDPLISYTNYSQSLAHPFGADFREFAGILNYAYSKFDFSLQGNYGNYGLEPYRTEKMFDEGIGQRIKTDMMYLDGRVSYIINPRYNLRLELGGIVRRENNDLWKKNTAMLTFGLRASFRNLYYDF